MTIQSSQMAKNVENAAYVSHAAAGTAAACASIARAASDVADRGSPRLTLDVLADAVRMAVGLAATQVVWLQSDERPTVVGMAGFRSAMHNFPARLARCRRLGADLVMGRVVQSRRPAAVLHRQAIVMADARWKPIRRLLASAEWDSFACAPLLVRDRAAGVLTAFYPPDTEPDRADLELLSAVADQVAAAADHAALLSTAREQARRHERERLARDLHDSVSQQVFSLRLQAQALAGYGEVAGGGPPLDVDRIGRTAKEMASLATAALADLRDLMCGLRCADVADRGLVEAINAYAHVVQATTGLTIRVECPRELIGLEPELAEDLYRIIREALHNIVKHARAATARIRVDVCPGIHVVVDIRDDGTGIVTGPGGRLRLGMTSMAERAGRWGGTVEVSSQRGVGTRVLARIPHPSAERTAKPEYAMAERAA